MAPAEDRRADRPAALEDDRLLTLGKQPGRRREPDRTGTDDRDGKT